ncbi:hypothetical protein BJ912DRAFT_954075 [Pholiota molesta]|nr:hypothetical protein BJ912DRAFT_954075 [Pholiota molesta]
MTSRPMDTPSWKRSSTTRLNSPIGVAGGVQRTLAMETATVSLSMSMKCLATRQNAGLVDEAKRIHLVCCPEDANPIVLGARAVETKRAQPGSHSEQWASCGCGGGLCTGDNALLAPFKVGVYSDGIEDLSKVPASWNLVSSKCMIWYGRQRGLSGVCSRGIA